MVIMLDNRGKQGEASDEMIPFFSIASRDFDKDLVILKKVLHQFEQRTHSENAYKLSERATLAAGWWFYDVSLNVILYRGYFNYYCLIILHIQKKEATDERMYHVSIWNIPGSNSGSNKDNNDN
jgi:hypothetical protein